MAWLDELSKVIGKQCRAALLRCWLRTIRSATARCSLHPQQPPVRDCSVRFRMLTMTSAKFRDLLQDLGASVVETYGTWSTASWTQAAPAAANTAAAGQPANPGQAAPAAAQTPRATGRR